MKRIIILLVSLFVLASILAGCSNYTNKNTEKIIENEIKDKTGADADIDISEGSYKAKDKEGNEMQIGGDIKWPEKLPADIPQYPGKITSVSDNNTNFVITIEKYEEKPFNDYMDLLIQKGFSKSSESKIAAGMYIAAFEKNNIQLTLSGTTAESNSSVIISANIK